MKYKSLGLLVGAAALLGAGCTDVGENQLGVRKTPGGNVFFHEGPSFEYLGMGTTSLEWNGRRVIDLPLGGGSERTQSYETADGPMMIDINIAYRLAQTNEDREKWFVKVQNVEYEFPKSVEGIVRSTVKSYTKREILNEEAARENKKLPLPQQIALDLSNSTINGKYGVDAASYAVWPENFSPLQRAVQADLDRQRKVILREGRAEAQKFRKLATDERAKVDGAYAAFITNLKPAHQLYLRTLEVAETVEAVGKAKGQDVDITLVVP